jgi:hypothetical protein
MNEESYVSNPTLSILRGKLRVIMNDNADAVATGVCRSFDEYAKKCGVIEGLAIAERELIDLSKKLEGTDPPNGDE